jgi:hypothetical protein
MLGVCHLSFDRVTGLKHGEGQVVVGGGHHWERVTLR